MQFTSVARSDDLPVHQIGRNHPNAVLPHGNEFSISVGNPEEIFRRPGISWNPAGAVGGGENRPPVSNDTEMSSAVSNGLEVDADGRGAAAPGPSVGGDKDRPESANGDEPAVSVDDSFEMGILWIARDLRA